MREQQSCVWTKSPHPPSEVSGTVVHVLFLLQMLEKDSRTGEGECWNGQHKLQAAFERAQHDSKDPEGDVANIDWGEYPSGHIYYSAHVCVAFWGAVMSGMCIQRVTCFILSNTWPVKVSRVCFRELRTLLTDIHTITTTTASKTLLPSSQRILTMLEPFSAIQYCRTCSTFSLS